MDSSDLVGRLSYIGLSLLCMSFTITCLISIIDLPRWAEGGKWIYFSKCSPRGQFALLCMHSELV